MRTVTGVRHERPPLCVSTRSRDQSRLSPLLSNGPLLRQFPRRLLGLKLALHHLTPVLLERRRRSTFAPWREESLDTPGTTAALQLGDPSPSPGQEASNRELALALTHAINGLDAAHRVSCPAVCLSAYSQALLVWEAFRTKPVRGTGSQCARPRMASSGRCAHRSAGSRPRFLVGRRTGRRTTASARADSTGAQW
jgi:hypothetical protein